MKHENPTYNISLAEARTIRTFLNQTGFIVRAINCNPNTNGAAGVTMVPEQNIPDDGQPYNLVFLFEGTGPRDFHQVTVVRDLIRDPSINNLRVLHKTLWSSGMQADLDARLLRNSPIAAAVNAAIREIAFGVQPPVREEPEKTAPAPKKTQTKPETSDEDLGGGRMPVSEKPEKAAPAPKKK